MGKLTVRMFPNFIQFCFRGQWEGGWKRSGTGCYYDTEIRALGQIHIVLLTYRGMCYIEVSYFPRACRGQAGVRAVQSKVFILQCKEQRAAQIALLAWRKRGANQVMWLWLWLQISQLSQVKPTTGIWCFVYMYKLESEKRKRKISQYDLSIFSFPSVLQTTDCSSKGMVKKKANHPYFVDKKIPYCQYYQFQPLWIRGEGVRHFSTKCG